MRSPAMTRAIRRRSSPPAPQLLATATSRPPVKPSFALVRSPVWEKAEDDVREGFAELAEALGDRIDEVELPEPFARAHAWHRAINMAEMARNYARYYDTRPVAAQRPAARHDRGGPGGPRRRLHPRARRHCRAERRAGEAVRALRRDRHAGGARRGAGRLEATGDPAFYTLWTYCGVPALTLPLLTGSNGMPIGVQLVGRRLYDGRLLRTARWLIEDAAGRGAGHRRGDGRRGMSTARQSVRDARRFSPSPAFSASSSGSCRSRGSFWSASSCVALCAYDFVRSTYIRRWRERNYRREAGL